MTESHHHNLRQRFIDMPVVARNDTQRIEPGTKDDYRALARFHYKGRLPGVITAAYRAVHDEPTVVGRYLHKHGERRIIGVLLRALPHLGCELRDHATHHRYRGLGWRRAATMINREFRTISRVIIDPQWRGVGLAVRLVKHALSDPETEFTEALAAMGRVHPFFERAGMTRYERPPRAEHARLIDALTHAGIPPTLLASHALLCERLAALPHETQSWVEAELRRWHRAAFRTTRRAVATMPIDDLLRDARDHLFANPIYYLCDHRPCSRNAPSDRTP